MTEKSKWANFNDIRIAIQSPRGPTRATTRNVLLTLHSFGNPGCNCWPSHVEIAKRARNCVRTIQTHLKYAEHEGWIVRRRRWNPGSRQYHTVYLLRIPELLPETVAGADEPNPSNDDRQNAA